MDQITCRVDRVSGEFGWPFSYLAGLSVSSPFQQPLPHHQTPCPSLCTTLEASTCFDESRVRYRLPEGKCSIPGLIQQPDRGRSGLRGCLSRSISHSCLAGGWRCSCKFHVMIVRRATHCAHSSNGSLKSLRGSQQPDCADWGASSPHPATHTVQLVLTHLTV